MKNVLAFFCFCLPLASQAQRLTKESSFKARNAVYVEALGSGGFYSVNYERLLLVKEKQAYGVRVGTSYFGSRHGNFVLIGELFTMVGKGNHHADFGIGVTGVSRRIIAPDLTGQLRKNLVIAVPRLSYRYQKPAGGLMVRAGFTPIIELSNTTSSRFGPWFGLAIGHSF